MNSIRSLRPWYLKLQKIIFFAKLFSSELCLLDLIWLGSLNRRLRSYEPPESRLMDSCFTCFFSRSFPLPFIFHFLSHFFPLRLHIFFLHLWEAPRPRGHSCHDEEIDAFVSFHALISHFKLSVGLKSMVLSLACFLASWDPRYTRRAR